MSRLIGVVAFLVVASWAIPWPAQAQESCRFVLGFAALRESIGPQKVGTCLENERFNDENGNAEQRTSGGLLVWRKVDNFTAFTDGGTTWIAGPNGLQSRPNADRFSWEKDPPSAPRAAAANPGTTPPAATATTSAASAPVASDVNAYLQWVGTRLLTAAEGLTALGEQSELASQRPTLISNDAWKTKTAMALVQIRSAGEQLQEYPEAVPPAAQKLNGMVKELGVDLVYITVEYAAGIDQVSQPRMRNALGRMNALGPKLDAATSEIRRLRSGAAGPPATDAPPRAAATATPAASSESCHPSYPDFCIPPPPAEVNCNSRVIAGRKNFRVTGQDVHRLDQGGRAGIACES